MDFMEQLRACPATAPLAAMIDKEAGKPATLESVGMLLATATRLLQEKQEIIDELVEQSVHDIGAAAARHVTYLKLLKERTPQQEFDLEIYEESGFCPIGFDVDDNFVWDADDIIPFGTKRA